MSSITKEKRPQRPETGIKDGFEEIELQFPFLVCNIPSEKNRTAFISPLLPDIFDWKDPKSHVPFTFHPEFPGNSLYMHWSTTVTPRRNWVQWFWKNFGCQTRWVFWLHLLKRWFFRISHQSTKFWYRIDFIEILSDWGQEVLSY